MRVTSMYHHRVIYFRANSGTRKAFHLGMILRLRCRKLGYQG